MSFEDLKLPELRTVVKEFVGEEDSVNVKNKKDAIAVLADEGITYTMYEAFKDAESQDIVPDKKEEPVVSAKKVFSDEPDVLVKMDRKNPTFEIRGHVFTKEHPFVAMSASEYQAIVDTGEEGFRQATPREVTEYYG